MSGPSNYDRAEWAMTACRAFGAETGQDVEHDLREIVGDLIANLLHLCDEHGIDGEDMIDNGRMHYEAEVEEREDDDE